MVAIFVFGLNLRRIALKGLDPRAHQSCWVTVTYSTSMSHEGGGALVDFTDLVRLAAPGLFVQEQSQAVGHSQQALRQGTVRERLCAVQTVC